jgi:hypothetical protein
MFSFPNTLLIDLHLEAIAAVQLQLWIRGSIRISGASRSGGLNTGGVVVVGETRVPSFEQWPERAVERACPELQEQMGAAFGPLHLLTLGEALADHRIHGGFWKAGVG